MYRGVTLQINNNKLSIKLNDEYRKIKLLLGFSVLFDKNLIVYNYFEKQSSIGLEHKLLDKFSIRNKTVQK